MAPIYAWEQEDIACVVDERPPGISLAKLVNQRKRLPPHEVVSVLEGVAYAMKQAEGLGCPPPEPHPVQIWLCAEAGKDISG
uniref:hypothetical protein n=1 Tax=Fusobacterium mortiferum TaxID=850 RepID=UPI0019588928